MLQLYDCRVDMSRSDGTQTYALQVDMSDSCVLGVKANSLAVDFQFYLFRNSHLKQTLLFFWLHPN